MSESESEAVSAWVNRAEEDYLVAVALMRQRKRPVFASVCYHCQQCIEKYLKAFILTVDQARQAITAMKIVRRLLRQRLQTSQR